jgi:NMD protein affecting ribosome stability and mRNA decay
LKKTHKKEFDAVKMMREIREKLGHKYWKNPELLKKDTEEAIKKYKMNVAKR